MDYTIHSQQDTVSPRIQRHVGSGSDYLRPMPHHQQAVFATIAELWAKREVPMVLDSGCGRALSSQLLHRQYPGHRVLGLDQSLDRLSRSGLLEVADGVWGDPDRGLLVARMNLIDAWRLLRTAHWPIERHYLWYPNPWPKAKHAKRRFHAHPVFSDCLALSPYFECRTQWVLYAKEFMAAVGQHEGFDVTMDRVPKDSACSHFEKKYQANDLPLWRVKVRKRL